MIHDIVKKGEGDERPGGGEGASGTPAISRRAFLGGAFQCNCSVAECGELYGAEVVGCLGESWSYAWNGTFGSDDSERLRS